ncbi:MAG: molecular chaperone [Acidiferrobacterales bacterium]
MNLVAEDTGAGTTQRSARTAEERGNLYGFLAAVYRAEPTVELLRQLKETVFLDALSSAGVSLDGDILGSPETQLAEDLAIEYTRLFLGPGKHVSPHGSAHMPGEDGLLWRDSTVAAKTFMESLGVDLDSEYSGLPDHISVELEFMQKLAQAEARAWHTGDRARAMSYRSIEKEFLDNHLSRWVPVFCDKVGEQAAYSFYREMAKLLDGFIATDKEELARSSQGK